jgi:hypothetical protein
MASTLLKFLIKFIDRKMRGQIFKTSTLVLPFIALLLFFPTPASAKNVTLAWGQNSRAAGYKVYYKPGNGGGRKLANYNGKGATEGDSPITMPVSLDENSASDEVEFTLHGLADNKKFVFVVTALDNAGLESSGSREIQILGPGDISAPYNQVYNSGWSITADNLQGFTVLYHDNNVIVPTLGSSYDIPALSRRITGIQGVGAALNLQPSGTHFSPAVTLFIPTPGYSDASVLDIYYYDDTQGQWFLAHDADDDPDIVQPEAAGWLVPDSRVNHNNGNSSTIEIQVNHFSGVQAGVVAGASTSSGSVVTAGSGGGGCFIDALRGK